MKRDTFDVLVIGGGITGAGVARDAALRGLSVALVEKGDFASGTSSKTSRMVHGGLRYVAQGQFGVVAESCVERDRLWRLARRLVWPTPFTAPVYRHTKRGLLMARVGLGLYDLLARFRNYRRHRMLTPDQVLAAEPAVNRDGLIGGAVYYDCRANDARLTLAVVQSAHEHGAVVTNYVEVRGLVKERRGEDGEWIVGAEVVDRVTNESFPVRARVTVNATGVWADHIRQMDDPAARPMMRPSRGSHIVLPKHRLGAQGTVTFTASGRARFAVEWGHMCIVGTTDADHPGDLDDVQASAAEVEDLLAAVNEAFPAAQITRADIRSTYAGVRPLVLEEGKSAYQVSRAHRLVESDSGLVTITGGKLTTYRQMAEETVDRVVRKLQTEHGVRPRRGCQTARLPLTDPAFDPDLELARFTDPNPRFDRDVLAHLIVSYGPAYSMIVQMAWEDEDLGRRIVPGLPYIRAEIPYAVQHEMALTVSDFLIRRTHIIYDDPQNGLGCAADVVSLMTPLLGWDAAEVARQLAEYQRQVELVRPPVRT